MQNGSILDLLPEEARTPAFRKSWDGLFKGTKKQLSQLIELGPEQKPLVINLIFRPLQGADPVQFCLVHGQDATSEHISRMALLDRERKLKEMRAAAQAQGAEISALREQITTLEQAAAGREHAAQDAVEHLADLTDTVERQAAEIERMQELLSGRDQTITELNAVRAEMDAELARLAAAADQHLAECSQLQTQLAELEQTSEKLRSNKSEQEAAHAALENTVAQLTADIERLESELLERDTEITRWKSDAAAHADEQSTAAADLQRQQEEIADLRRQIIALENAAAVREHESSAAQDSASAAGHDARGLRVLAGGLAEDFSNLLTGVLGHSSLAAAEIGESHAALKDVRAIERSARNAARLIRRLTAMCGASRRHGTPLDLSSYLKSYATRDRADYFPAGAALLDVGCDTCLVNADASVMEITLDGMAEHARRGGDGTAVPVWSLRARENNVDIVLTFGGAAAPPPGWSEDTLSGLPRTQVADVLFAREAARTLGGDIEIQCAVDRTELVLTIPRASQPAAAER